MKEESITCKNDFCIEKIYLVEKDSKYSELKKLRKIVRGCLRLSKKEFRNIKIKSVEKSEQCTF